MMRVRLSRGVSTSTLAANFPVFSSSSRPRGSRAIQYTRPVESTPAPVKSRSSAASGPCRGRGAWSPCCPCRCTRGPTPCSAGRPRAGASSCYSGAASSRPRYSACPRACAAPCTPPAPKRGEYAQREGSLRPARGERARQGATTMNSGTRLAPTPDTCSLPSHDWLLLRVHALYPHTIGSYSEYTLSTLTRLAPTP
eukprot:1180949-Prorocentrum_minimum.AAC.1